MSTEPLETGAAEAEELDPKAGQAAPDADAGQAEKPAAQEQAEEAEGKQEQQQRPRLDGVQKRINELTRKAREAERERDYYKALASQTAQLDSAEPNPADFDDDAAYFRALARYEAMQAVAEATRQASEQRAQEARLSAWQARQSAAKAMIPDYDAVVANSDIPIAGHLADAIMESEQGPALAYYLAKNPDIAEALNGMTPIRAAIEIGRLEQSLAAPVAKQQSRAPAPPNILNPSSANVRDFERMSVAEYIEWRMKGG